MELAERESLSHRPGAAELVNAHTAVNQAMASMLDLMARLDTPEARVENSVTDMAAWLQFDLGLEPKTARAWNRVSEALLNLPLTRKAFQAGSVSFDEVRILCHHATRDNEAALLALTRYTQADELAKAIRDELEIERPRPERLDENPWLRMWWSEDESFLKLRGEIPGVDGLLVETVLQRYVSQAPLDPASGLHRDPDVVTAEALVQIASEAGAADSDHDRATVVVHFDAGDLESGRTSGWVGDQLVDKDELLRLLCDSRLQPAIDDPSGVTVGVGRISRKIPAWLRRTLDGRDGGCRFPGCARTRWTHAHHLIHWAEGGPTNLDNLVTLCGFHHRLIHKKGWQLEGSPNGTLTFFDHLGYEYQPARPRFDPGHRARLLDCVDHYYGYRLERLALANSPP